MRLLGLKRRRQIEESRRPVTTSDLQYLVHRLVDDYLDDLPRVTRAELHGVVGVLACVQSDVRKFRANGHQREYRDTV